MQHRHAYPAHGFIALTSVVILGGLLLLVAIGLSLRSIDAEDAGFAASASAEARALADACVDEGILRLQSNFNYSGNEAIIVEGNRTCMIRSVSGSGNTNRVLVAEGEVVQYRHQITVDIAMLTPTLSIRSFTEE